jgi:L-malate glycosyltransferase
MKKKKLTALWLPSWYPTPTQPTLGIFTRRDAEAVSMFCNVIVLYAIESQGCNYEIRKKSISPNLTEIRIFYPSGSKLTKLIRFLRAYRNGFRQLESDGVKPDVLHLHVTWPAGIAGLFYLFQNKAPIIISENWSEYLLANSRLSGVRKRIAKYVVGHATTVFTVTRAMAEGMQFYGLNGRYKVNPNVINPVISNRYYSKKNVRKGIFRFIHVSSLDDEHKNIRGMLRAVRSLTKRHSDFEFVIVGGDEGTAYFGQMVREMAIGKWVRFTGVLEHEAVMREIAGSDAFVLFSNREGLPCVLLEAMSVGVPVISTAIPGLEDWVGSGQGHLIPIGDESALMEVMSNFLNAPEQFDPEEVRQKVMTSCSYETVGRRIFREYQRALGLLPQD